MDTTKFTMGIVGLVVIILMVTGAVIPAVENAQDDQRTIVQNTGAYYVSKMDSNITAIDFEIAIDGSNVTVNDYTVNLSSYSFMRVPIVVTDQFFVILNAGGSAAIGYYGYGNDVFSSDTISSISISIGSDGTYTATAGATTDSGTITKLIYAAKNGDMGFFNPSVSPVWIDNNVKAYAVTNSWRSGYGDMSVLGEFDKSTFTLISSGIHTGTMSNVQLSKTIAESTDLAYKLATSPSFTATLTVSDTDESVTLSNVGVIAPIDYTTISDNDASMISLFGIIPLLLIIVAVLYAVRLMGASRN